MKHTGERCIPWEAPPTKRPSFARHIRRYGWATQFAVNKSVVDLGCGCGYGTHMLSMVANGAIGYDNDLEAIGFAIAYFERFERKGCLFDVADIEREPVPSDADLYIAFEILEHLNDPAALVKRLHGKLVWSLPLDRTSKFHKHDYNLEQATALMAGSEFWYQAGEKLAPQARAWFAPDTVIGVLDCK